MNEDLDNSAIVRELFQHALNENDVSAIKRLMSLGMDPDSDIGSGITPLVAAGMSGHLELTNALIDAGADVNLADRDGETALSLTLAIACKPSDEEDDSADEDAEENAAFWQQVFAGPHVQIARVLMQAGARADTTNEFIKRFFIISCSEGSTELVATLLEHGADANVRDVGNMTPLMYAISQPEVFRLLLDHGADVNLECAFGVTVLDSLLDDSTLDLAQAVIDRGANVNERNYYLTRAAADGKMNVVQFLLRNGADANQTDDEGKTASYFARLFGHRDIALLLREARGLPKIEPSLLTRKPTLPQELKRPTHLKGNLDSLRTKDFRRDKKEIFLRSWWLAYKVSETAIAQFEPTAISSWINDVVLRKQDQKLLFEALGYAMSFVLDRLCDEIAKFHGWTDETYDLHSDYRVFLGKAFDQVFGFETQDEGVFNEILRNYYLPEYDDGYDDLWEVSNKPEEALGKKNTLEALSEPPSEDDYNIERYYVYRLSKMLNIVDLSKVIENILPYRNIGLTFYDKAFFGLNSQAIEKELRQLLNH